MDKFLIIDANSIINRAFYAIRPLTNKNGLNTNGIFGFLNILLKETGEEKPKYIACAFDVSRHTFRTDIYGEYKGTRRETPAELKEQFAPLKKVLKAMNIAVLELNNYEADDIIGTVSKKCSENKIACDILTGDKDDLQLIDDFVNVKLIITKAGKTDTTRMDEAALFEKYGLKPFQMIELKALMGDKSDNIPGVRGIGEVTGINLIKEYSTLDGVYENIENIKPSVQKKLIEDKENAYLSKTIGTIKRDVPIDFEIKDCEMTDYNSAELFSILTELEFGSFIKKLGLDGTPTPKKHEITVSDGFPDGLNRENEIFYAIVSDSAAALYNGNVYKFPLDCESFVNMLENPGVKKISFDIKAQLHEKFVINGEICDLGIMAHICNAKNKHTDIFKVYGEYLGESVENFFEAVYFSKNLYKYMTEKIEGDGLIYINVLEHELIRILYDMETDGVKIDIARLKEITNHFNEKANELLKKIYILAGEEFNVSSPKQLGTILFEKLGLPSGKKTKTGYSTNAEVLEKLTGTHEIIDYIKEYRLVTKLSSTYCEGFLKLMDSNGLLHTTYNQTLTQTGRLSSTEPNLQNIPVRSEEGRKIRSTIVPKNGIFVSADYSQIELRVLAHIADDENLQRAFAAGDDIHALTARKIFGLSGEDEVEPDMRRASKAINFGLIYGKGAFSLAKDLKITRAEASEYIEKYLGSYPNVKKYMADVIEDAKDKGYTKTLYGRRRYFPEFSQKNKMLIAAGERAALNSPIQGTAADIIKIAMIKVYNELKKSGLKSKLVLQIHDELIIDCCPEERAQIEALLVSSMENAVNIKAPLTVSLGEGKNLDECK